MNLRSSAAALLAWFAVLCPARAQQPDADPATEPPRLIRPAPEDDDHPFWDPANSYLFAGVAATRVLDFVSTREFRSRGVDEILLTNRIVDNKPLFVGIEAGSVLANMGVAYWFHRRGNHKIERWVSAIHISVGSFGATRNYQLTADDPHAFGF